MARDRKRRTPSPQSPRRSSKGKKKINYLGAGATALSFYSIFKSLTGILFGVIMLMAGVFINSRPAVDVKQIKGTVTSVSWFGTDGCAPFRSTDPNTKKTTTQYQCSVVVKSNDLDKSDQHTFTYVGDRTFHPNQVITVYKEPDGTIELDNPNSFEILGPVFILIGAGIILSSIFWIWFCSKNKKACGALTGIGMVAGALNPAPSKGGTY